MNSEVSKPEIWLQGKISGIPDLLQPAAHALLQARKDVKLYVHDFPNDLLWSKPAGRASTGFHLQHLTGVLDRMLTYAAGEDLTGEQFLALKKEGKPDPKIYVKQLVKDFDLKVEEAISIIKKTSVKGLTKERVVGRKKLPSTVIGILFHAAEHSQRHVGQLLVTQSIVRQKYLET